MNNNTRQSLEKGVQLHQAGQLPRAEAFYRHVLQNQPENPDALHLLGVLFYQTQRTTQAVELIGQAIAINPAAASYHTNLGNALRAMGRRADAIAAYRQAVSLAPGLAEAQNNLSLALQDDGQFDEALAVCQTALELKPDYPEAHNNLGNVLLAKRKLADAIACYRKALELKPDFAEAHNNLGNAMAAIGDSENAVACYRKAIAIKPGYPAAHFNLGSVLAATNRIDAAIACYRQAIALNPEYPEAYNNLGRALKDNGDLDDSVAAYRKAIALRPDYADALSNLGIALIDSGLVEEAIGYFRKVVALRPADAENHSHLLLALNYVPSDHQTLLKESQAWAQQHAAGLHSEQTFVNDRAPGRRLRIGYVSADFWQHPSMLFFMPLVDHHDRRAVEVFCYADVAKPDNTTGRVKEYACAWRDTGGLSDAQMADLIRDDQIDILVDLKLHTDRNRLLVFARKPAPIQVTWLGYPGTTGLAAIDYRLTDGFLDPPGDPLREWLGLKDTLYAEQSIRLPDCFWCYDPLTDATPVGPLPGLEHNSVTFGCLNNFSKITAQVLELWSRILNAVPGSRLVLLCDLPSRQAWITETLRKFGIDSERIEFAHRRPRRQYLGLYQRIDLCLDPMPCCGHTTTFDSLWMGVPVVTLPGQTPISRAGLSILTNLGLTELVAQSTEQYVQIATDLASDLPRLGRLRSSLRDAMKQSPLMDGLRFARNIEAAYRQTWRRWCANPNANAPASVAGAMPTPQL